MTEDEIIVHAKRDHRESGGGAYANPFPAGSPGFDAYERGWMQALKQDNKSAFAPYLPPAAPAQPRTSAPTQKPSVNLYALAKGRSGLRK